jgi:hypothetical protein
MRLSTRSKSVATQSILQFACRNTLRVATGQEWQLLTLGRHTGRSVTSPALALSVTQRRFAATGVRLAAVGNSSRHDCSVEIVIGSTCNGLAGAPVTTKKPLKRGNCLVPNLSVWAEVRMPMRSVTTPQRPSVRHRSQERPCSATLRTDATGLQRAR